MGMIQDLLKNHVGYVIAINATDPEKLESCGLKSASKEFFSIVIQNLAFKFRSKSGIAKPEIDNSNVL